MKSNTRLMIGFALLAIGLLISVGVWNLISSQQSDVRQINDISELRSGSDAIVLGTVTSIISVESGEDSVFVEIEVERYRKMPLEASSRVVLYYTRSSTEFVTPEEEIIIDDVSGVEWGFKVGERVYVFLKSLTPDYYEVYGGFQGKYSVIDGVAVNSIGWRISIPAPFSPIVMIEVGFGIAVLVTLWMKRDWLSERIGGVTNG